MTHDIDPERDGKIIVGTAIALVQGNAWLGGSTCRSSSEAFSMKANERYSAFFSLFRGALWQEIVISLFV